MDRELQRVQGRLVAVEHHQLGGLVAVDLAAQLGADRAAGAGHEHLAALDVVGDRVDVGVELVAAQHVGEVDVAQVADADVVAQELRRGGQHLDPQVGRSSSHPQPLDDLRGRTGNREHDRARLEPLGGRGQLVGGADDGHAVDAEVPLEGIVVQQGDRLPLLAGSRMHRSQQLAAGLAGSDDDDPLRVVSALAAAIGLVEPPPRRASPRRQDQGEQRGARRDAPRHPLAHQVDEEHHAAGTDDVQPQHHHLVEGPGPGPTLVETGHLRRRQVEGDGPAGGTEDVEPRHDGAHGVEPQPREDREPDQPRSDVERHRHPCPAPA